MRTLPQRISKPLVRLRMITTTALLFSAATMFGGTVAEGSTTSAAVTTSTGRLTCKPSTLNFGKVALHHAKNISVTITNTGSRSLTVTKKINAAHGVFWLSNLKVPLTLNAGRSVRFYAQFHPPAIGPASGHIYLISNASNPKLTIALSGMGEGSNSLAPNPSSIGFGSVQIGKSLTRNETLTNSGTSSIPVSSATISGSGFSWGGLSLPLILAAGHSVTFSITFTPKTRGTASGSVSVNSSALNSTLKVNLTGTGGPPSALTVTTASLPKATVGTAYSATVSASGGTPPYRWALASGRLPAGLALASTGAISGKPTTPGSSTLTVQVSDSASAVAKAGYTFNVGSASSKAIIWSAGMEIGNKAEWYYPSPGAWGYYGGGEYDSGIASMTASTNMAHSGTWGAKMTITTPHSPTSGTRMFRWMEPRANRALYYSVWVYIPTLYRLTGNPSNGHFWNLMQFKSRTADNSHNDPVWAFYIDDSHAGQYFLKTGWGWGGTRLAGPYSGNGVSGKWFKQTVAPLPIGQWVHLEAFLRESSGFDGQLTLWQDGVKLFDFQNVITSYNNCNYNSWCVDNEWAVDLYSDGLTPNPATIYIDDAKIATGFVQ